MGGMTAKPPAPVTTAGAPVCPSWCKGGHSPGSDWHAGEAVTIGGEAEGSWYALAGLLTEDGATKVDLELCDGDDDATVAVSISLADARKLAQALAGLARTGHAG
jgi:hypothetical protein